LVAADAVIRTDGEAAVGFSIQETISIELGDRNAVAANKTPADLVSLAPKFERYRDVVDPSLEPGPCRKPNRADI
jgi:hypothetical protein